MTQRSSHAGKKAKALTILMVMATLVANLTLHGIFKFVPTAQAEIKNSSGMDVVTGCDTNAARSPSTGMDENGNYVIAYSLITDCPAGNSAVWFKLYNSSGTPYDPQISEHLVTTGSVTASQNSQINPSVTMDHSGNFIIAWQENNIIYAQLFTNGASVAPASRISFTDTADNPQVSMNFYGGTGNPNEAIVVWHGTKAGADADGGIYARHLSLNYTTGITVDGTDQLVNSDATEGDQSDPTIAMNSLGKSIIAWSDHGNIMIQRYARNNNLIKIDANQQVNITSNVGHANITASKSNQSPGSNMPGAHFLISYDGGTNFDVFARFINDCDNSCSVNNNEIYVNSNRDGRQSKSHISADFDGNYVITWEDNASEIADTRIAAQSYQFQYDPLTGHGAGKKLGKQFYSDAGEANTGRQTASVSMDIGGNYIISWLSTSNSVSKIKYQRYYPDAYKPFFTNSNTGESFSVEATETLIDSPNGNSSATALSPAGEHVVVWKGSDGIYFTLYNANNEMVKENQRVDTYTDDGTPDNTSGAAAPSVDFWKDTTGDMVGAFTITYEGYKPVSSDHNPRSAEADELRTIINSRTFNANGSPVGASRALIGLNDSPNTFHNAQIKYGYGFYPSDQTAIGHFAVAYLKNAENGDIIPEIAYSEYLNGESATPLSITALSGTLHAYNAHPIPNSIRLALYPNPSGQDQMVVVWTDSVNGSSKDIFMRETIGSTLKNNTINISSTTLNNNADPDIAFVSNKNYVAVWSSGTEGYGKIYGAYYHGSFDNADPNLALAMIGPRSILEPTGNIDKYLTPRIGGNPETGNAFIAATALSNSETESAIRGLFLYADPTPEVGSSFTINTTPSKTEILPAVDMGPMGLITVSWENSYISDNNHHGLAGQLFLDPRSSTPTSFPTISNQQTINKGTASLTITPNTITFPEVTAKTNESQESIVTGLEIEVSDLDGITPHTISISSTDFTSGNNTITKDHVYVKNYDDVTAFVDSEQSHPHTRPAQGCVGCGDNFDTTGFNQLENIPSNPADFLLNEETYSYASLDQTRVLADTLGNGAGKMKFYPALKLVIPAFTVPGTYSGTITITQS